MYANVGSRWKSVSFLCGKLHGMYSILRLWKCTMCTRRCLAAMAVLAMSIWSSSTLANWELGNPMGWQQWRNTWFLIPGWGDNWSDPPCFCTMIMFRDCRSNIRTSLKKRSCRMRLCKHMSLGLWMLALLPRYAPHDLTGSGMGSLVVRFGSFCSFQR